MDSRNCQTWTVTPAKPGDYLLYLFDIDVYWFQQINSPDVNKYFQNLPRNYFKIRGPRITRFRIAQAERRPCRVHRPETTVRMLTERGSLQAKTALLYAFFSELSRSAPVRLSQSAAATTVSGPFHRYAVNNGRSSRS